MIESTINKWLSSMLKINKGAYNLTAIFLSTAIIILSGQKLSIASVYTAEKTNNNQQIQKEAHLAFDDLMPKRQPPVQDLQKYLLTEGESVNPSFGGLMPNLKRAVKDFQKYLGIERIEVEKLIQVVLRLGERRVYVYEGEQEIASYPVAVGKPGWETPTGEFKVIQLVENPQWQNPWTGEVMPAGPNTALGLRWIGFWTDGRDTIGFHGTPTVESIGYAASHGCVRMRNEDVIALFEKVQVGTTVVVEP
ncbi:MAG: L,D-transpeptidase [Okeania sp. SIO2C9]|uniref:L,D-transpeptidase n=1 Tax=Okeania sp. SIO2C9 TaxID=2607791 RepID=UPI0013C08349|nr:L,D-transpeptidase [Okeania sp. SIO2C9]NEQ76631.1 L,D-transpeptidase [Okeania sp. SIO2C9]